MKIKELLNFNPEAELEIIMPTGLPFSGKLDLGWDANGDYEEGTNTKSIATSVSIYLGNNSEDIKH